MLEGLCVAYISLIKKLLQSDLLALAVSSPSWFAAVDWKPVQGAGVKEHWPSRAFGAIFYVIPFM